MRITLNAGALMRYNTAAHYHTDTLQGMTFEAARELFAGIAQEFMLSSPSIGDLFCRIPLPADIEPTAAFNTES